MTDYRVCDGPDCEQRAVLNPRVTVLNNPDANMFVTVTGAYTPPHLGEELHFHNEDCMLAWTRENNK